MSDTSSEARPAPCFNRPRCRRPKYFNVNAGTIAGGHLIGEARSCELHLAASVAYAAGIARPVMVTDMRAVDASASLEQVRMFQFREAVSA